MPPSAEHVTEYTGHLIHGLTSVVEQRYIDEERMGVIVRLASHEPAAWLAQVAAHFDEEVSDRFPRDLYDRDAYVVLQRLQTCLTTGLTDICAECGRMEGDHGNWIPTCPVQLMFSGDPRLSRTFRRKV